MPVIQDLDRSCTRRLCRKAGTPIQRWERSRRGRPGAKGCEGQGVETRARVSRHVEGSPRQVSAVHWDTSDNSLNAITRNLGFGNSGSSCLRSGIDLFCLLVSLTFNHVEYLENLLLFSSKCPHLQVLSAKKLLSGYLSLILCHPSRRHWPSQVEGARVWDLACGTVD